MLRVVLSDGLMRLVRELRMRICSEPFYAVVFWAGSPAFCALAAAVAILASQNLSFAQGCIPCHAGAASAPASSFLVQMIKAALLPDCLSLLLLYCC